MFEFIKDYWGQALSIISTAYAVAIFVLRRSFASVETVGKLDERIGNIEVRLANLPSQDEVHVLQVEITELRGDLKETNASLRALSHQNQLMLEKAINRSE